MPVKACSSSKSSKRLGLIAGLGRLPAVVSTEAKKKGYRVVVIALQPPADDSIEPFGDDFHNTINTYLSEKNMFYLIVGDAKTQLKNVARFKGAKPVMLNTQGTKI